MTDLPPKLAAPTRQRGMTLIEILVAIVVLSIGLLGLAGLQLKGLQVNQGSIYRWQAAMLAEDIADRMRTDQASALNNQYQVTANVPAATGSTQTQAVVSEWLQRVQMLPGGKADIGTATGPNNNQVQIKITWTDTRARAAVNQASGQDSFVLNTEF
jgi:type IV pilus assembly protein PilV